MIVVAIDPGKMTGIATYSDEGAVPPFIADGFGSFEVEVGEFQQFLVSVTALVGHDVRFVSESFIITAMTAKNTQAPWSLKHIGAFEFVAGVWFQTTVCLQAPSVGKTFGTDAKLRHVGWYSRGKGHANDAARHLMTYCATRGIVFSTDVLKELAEV